MTVSEIHLHTELSLTEHMNNIDSGLRVCVCVCVQANGSGGMCGLRAETGSCTVGCVQLSARALSFNGPFSAHGFTQFKGQLPDTHTAKKKKKDEEKNHFTFTFCREH